MLEYLRQGTRSTWVWATFGALIFVFIFFFGPQSQGYSPTERAWAGKIGSSVIHDTELDSAFQRAMDRQGQRGRLEDAEYFERKRAVLDDIAMVHLLADAAQEAGLAVGREELSCYIVNWNRLYNVGGERICEQFPADYPTRYPNLDLPWYSERDGSFSTSYRSDVRGNFAMAVDEYEAWKSRELLALKYLDILAGGVAVPPAMVNALFSRRYTTVDIEYIRLDPSAIGSVTPSEEQVAAWAPVHEAEIAAYYAEHQTEFAEERQVRVRRIYIRKPYDENDQSGLDEARSRYEAILARVQGGEDFTAVATEITDLERERENGGDMGLRTADTLSSDIYSATESMQVGDIQGVEQSFAWSIVRLDEVVDARTRPLDEVRTQIATSLLTDELTSTARSEVDERARRILELAATSGSLQDAAAAEAVERSAMIPAPGTGETAGSGESASGVAVLAVETTGPFAREREGASISGLGAQFQGFNIPAPPADEVPGIGRSRELARTVFSLTEDAPLHPEPIEVDGTSFIVRLRERSQPSEPTPEQYRELYDELRTEQVSSLIGLDSARLRLLVHANGQAWAPLLQALLDDALASGDYRVREELFAWDPVPPPGQTEP